MIKIMQSLDLRSVFLRETNLAFQFLITDYGFSEPIMKETNSYLNLYYIKLKIAIQVYLDKFEEDASVRIVCLEDGNIPEVWRMNINGKIVKEYLHTLLKHRGVKDFQYNMSLLPNTLSKRENNLRKSLITEAYWLKKYGQDILEGSAKIFEGYNEPGDRF